MIVVLQRNDLVRTRDETSYSKLLKILDQGVIHRVQWVVIRDEVLKFHD